jgi:hypothetical protein
MQAEKRLAEFDHDDHGTSALPVPQRTRAAIFLIARLVRTLPYAVAFAALCGLLQVVGIPVGGAALIAAGYGVLIGLVIWSTLVVHDLRTLMGPAPRLFSRQGRFWTLLFRAIGHGSADPS